MSMVPMSSGAVVDIGGRLALDNRGFQHALRESQGSIGDFGIAINEFRGRIVATGLAIGALGIGTLAWLRNSSSALMPFEVAMRNVQSISMATQANMQGMALQVLEVGDAANRSAIETAEGMYQVVSSGYDGAAALNILEAAAISASAGLSTTSTAAQAITGVLNAYGLEATDATDVSDTLFQTVNLGVGSFEDLATSIGQVIGLAAVARIPFDDVASAMAAMSLSSITFEEGAIGLNRLIEGLVAPGESLAKVFQRLGFESGQAALDSLGLHGVMELLGTEVGQNAEAWLTLLPDIRAVRSALALTANEGENYNRVQKGISTEASRAGAAQKAFEIQQKSLQAAMDEVRNSFEQFMIKALLPIIGVFTSVVGAFGWVIDMFDGLPGPIKTALVVTLGLTAALAILVGGALALLPLALTVVAQRMLYTAISGGALAASNSVVARSFVQAASSSAIFNAVMNFTNKTMMLSKLAIGGWIGVIMLAVTAVQFLSSQTKSTAEYIQDWSEMTNEALGQVFDPSWSKDVQDMSDDTKVALGSFLKAFEEAAKSRPEVAQRLLEQAEAAGINKDAIKAMKEIQEEASQVALENADATNEAAVAYETQGGVVVEVSQEVADALNETARAAEEYFRTWRMTDDPEEAMKSALDSVQSAKDSTLEAQAELDQARAEAGQAEVDRQGEIEDATRDVEGAQRDLAEAQKNANDIGKNEDPGSSQNSLVDKQVALADATERLNELRTGQPEEINRIAEAEERLAAAQADEAKAVEDAYVSKLDLINLQREQMRSMAEWANNLEILSSRVPAHILEELKKMGPESSQLLTEFTRMTDAELQEWIGLFDQKEFDALRGELMGNEKALSPKNIQGNLQNLYDTGGGDMEKFVLAANQLKVPKEELGEFLSGLKLSAEDIQIILDRMGEKFLADFGFEYDEDTGQILQTLRSEKHQLEYDFALKMSPEDKAILKWAISREEYDKMVSPTGGKTTPNFGAMAVAGALAGLRKNADGQIAYGPEIGIYGESGAEALIPLTRPGRALDLMKQSGLYSLAMKDIVYNSPRMGAGAMMTSSSSSVSMQHHYDIGTVVTQDANEFHRQMEQRSAMASLTGGA